MALLKETKGAYCGLWEAQSHRKHLRRTNWRGSAVLASLASTSQGSFHGPSTPPSWKKGTSAQNTSTSSVNCWKMSLDTAERNRTSASRSDRTAEHQSEKPNTFPNTWLASRYWPELNFMHSQTLLLLEGVPASLQSHQTQKQLISQAVSSWTLFSPAATELTL